MAGAVIAIIPPLLVFFIFRKSLVSGMPGGALKG
jgi:ABC-type glycerol-3-phosphate transport system permease component